MGCKIWVFGRFIASSVGPWICASYGSVSTEQKPGEGTDAQHAHSRPQAPRGECSPSPQGEGPQAAGTQGWVQFSAGLQSPPQVTLGRPPHPPPWAESELDFILYEINKVAPKCLWNSFWLFWKSDITKSGITVSKLKYLFLESFKISFRVTRLGCMLV